MIIEKEALRLSLLAEDPRTGAGCEVGTAARLPTHYADKGGHYYYS